ncbi:hypothetical protein BCAR13_280040 [Paraburkholderia caribensis]|nr:hypothetical protein BCAR13_280040 [Paraburkholderia caribensis]
MHITVGFLSKSSAHPQVSGRQWRPTTPGDERRTLARGRATRRGLGLRRLTTDRNDFFQIRRAKGAAAGAPYACGRRELRRGRVSYLDYGTWLLRFLPSRNGGTRNNLALSQPKKKSPRYSGPNPYQEETWRRRGKDKPVS